jgi:hypothetical protein
MMTEHLHAAFGLTFRSDFALPEMRDAGSAGAKADVTVKLGQICAKHIDRFQMITPFVGRSDTSWLITVPDVGRYLVNGTSEIVINPGKGADESSIRVFLLGSAIGMILVRRGFLVLHGSAIQVGRQCALALGASGAGKSTIAAGFHLLGHAVASDDLVAISPSGDVMPGLNRVKLWRDTADALSIDTTGLNRIRPELEKYALPVELPASPLQLSHVYEVHAELRDVVGVSPLSGLDRFMLLRRNLYRERYLRGDPLQAEQMALCSAVVARARFAEIRRPCNGFTLDAVLKVILADIGIGN